MDAVNSVPREFGNGMTNRLVLPIVDPDRDVPIFVRVVEGGHERGDAPSVAVLADGEPGQRQVVDPIDEDRLEGGRHLRKRVVGEEDDPLELRGPADAAEQREERRRRAVAVPRRTGSEDGVLEVVAVVAGTGEDRRSRRELDDRGRGGRILFEERASLVHRLLVPGRPVLRDGPHARASVEDDGEAGQGSGAHPPRRLGEGRDEGEEDRQLQQQQRIDLLAEPRRARLRIAGKAFPEEEGGYLALSLSRAEEVQNENEERREQQVERGRVQQRHLSSPPFRRSSCRNRSTGTSVVVWK
jgi:hypothetical protein